MVALCKQGKHDPSEDLSKTHTSMCVCPLEESKQTISHNHAQAPSPPPSTFHVVYLWGPVLRFNGRPPCDPRRSFYALPLWFHNPFLISTFALSSLNNYENAIQTVQKSRSVPLHRSDVGDYITLLSNQHFNFFFIDISTSLFWCYHRKSYSW